VKLNKQIEILESQLDMVDELERVENHALYDSWHTETGLLLNKILADSKNEVQEFHSLDGRSSVFIAGPNAHDKNIKRNTDAYFRDIKKGRSLLTGIVKFLKSTELMEDSTALVNVGTLEALHDNIKNKCSGLYLNGHYPEAVEKSFKVVRDRLRELTTYETGSEAFGKGGLYVKGAAAQNVDKDFQIAVKFLTMAIDKFRNEKSHTSDGNIKNPIRAYEYLAISSLAMHLLADCEARHKIEQPKKEKIIIQK
jgi:uncharacterized protein (TIGR02391 family)